MFGSAGVPTRPAGYTGDGSRADSGIPPAASRPLHSFVSSLTETQESERARGRAEEAEQLHAKRSHDTAAAERATADAGAWQQAAQKSCAVAEAAQVPPRTKRHFPFRIFKDMLKFPY
jgi:hypothetical protein